MTSLHLCLGTFRGRPATDHRSHAAFAPYFRELAYDAFSLEFANRSMWEVHLRAEYGGDKTPVASIVDVKGRDAETPGIVAERIRTALRSVTPEKLWLSADCDARTHGGRPHEPGVSRPAGSQAPKAWASSMAMAAHSQSRFG